MRTTVIGLGAMGLPVVRHLCAAGVPVVAYDIDEAATAAAAALGARTAPTAAEAAADAQVVAVFVPTDDDVLAVCGALFRRSRTSWGESEIKPPQQVLDRRVLVLCSSIRPETCARVAAEVAGVDVLDAALTGGVRGAAAGEVNLLVGGDRAVLDRIRPVLEPWTSAVHHLGPLGSGQIGKTANNLVHWAQICAITEALELGRRAGVPVPLLRRALMDGPTDSRTLRELEHMRLTWHAKDLANTAALAKQVDMEVPVAETARAVMPGIGVEDVARLLAGGPLHLLPPL